MKYRIKDVEAVRYPVLRVTFDDGLSGEYDLTGWIGQGESSLPLKDPAYFKTVAVAAHGRSFGWNLDEVGHEIDFCPDAARITIETAMVEQLAAHYVANRPAAE
ncbi:MAG: molybdopterin-guanine dinucleotide biosynthesis protein [Bosea sp. 12-68-7]|nr:MAG: molybdopterin-guanine dinucleotide biosynthesis protein [Bosea sp. 12-68-7]OYX00194.1 MAG: molybdopterin-guanine dinucleotide biosynthesis protein [Bosea sp. 32-68-6]